MRGPSIIPLWLGLALLAICGAATTALARSGAGDDADGIEFFEKSIRPLLAEKCQKCHGGDKAKGGLSLTGREALLKGGDSGPAALPGRPRDSLLIQAVERRGELKMPPKGKLSPGEIERLGRWIERGLPWPEAEARAAPADRDAAQAWWSFQPVRAMSPPPLKDTTGPRSEIDRFILAGLEARGLRPAEPAGKRTLVRRVTFDLTGLPPTPGEVEAFLADESPDAFARVVDRLLASPRYGERWARHWLDLVRYTDEFDEVWRYRDWVIRAFNDDMPYDRFIIDQVAGDLVPASAPNTVNADGVVATTVLAIGPWGGIDRTEAAGRHRRRPGRHDRPELPRPDDRLRPLPRPQVRPDPDGRLLRPGGLLLQQPDPVGPVLPVAQGAPAEGPAGSRGPGRGAPPADGPGPRGGGPAPGGRGSALCGLCAGAACRRLADYLLAAWDYAHRPADQAGLSAEEFAGRRGLQGFAVKGWIDYLAGARAGEFRRLDRPVRDYDGERGVAAWMAAAERPWWAYNGTDHDVAIETFLLPPRSVSVNPGVEGGAVGWRSPVSGTVRVAGRLTDGDPYDGTGVAWAIDHLTKDGRHQLVSGRLPNGGSMRLDQGRLAERTGYGPGRGRRHHSARGRAGTGGRALRYHERRADDLLAGWFGRVGPGARRPGGFPREQPPRRLIGASGRLAIRRHGREPSRRPAAGTRPPAGRLGRGRCRRRGQPAGHREGRPRAGRGGRCGRSGGRLGSGAGERREPLLGQGPGRSPLPRPGGPGRDRRSLPASSTPPGRRLPSLSYASGIQEGGPRYGPYPGIQDARIYIRGSDSQPGRRVPRHFPEALAGTDSRPGSPGGAAAWSWRAGSRGPTTR